MEGMEGKKEQLKKYEVKEEMRDETSISKVTNTEGGRFSEGC